MRVFQEDAVYVDFFLITRRTFVARLHIYSSKLCLVANKLATNEQEIKQAEATIPRINCSFTVQQQEPLQTGKNEITMNPFARKRQLSRSYNLIDAPTCFVHTARARSVQPYGVCSTHGTVRDHGAHRLRQIIRPTTILPCRV